LACFSEQLALRVTAEAGEAVGTAVVGGPAVGALVGATVVTAVGRFREHSGKFREHSGRFREH
jgi:hypothetical protein